MGLSKMSSPGGHRPGSSPLNHLQTRVIATTMRRYFNIAPLLTLSMFFMACENKQLAPKARNDAAQGAAKRKMQPSKTTAERLKKALKKIKLKRKARAPAKPLTPTGLEAKKILTRLIAAHYDPSKQGLTSLSFRLEYFEAKRKLSAKAHGSWALNKKPTVALDNLSLAGSAVDKNGAQKGLWTGVGQHLKQLTFGLGSGFLSQRLQSFLGKEGHFVATKSGNGERLFFNTEFGTMTFDFDHLHRVRFAENRSPKKVTRSMTYRTQLIEKKYNLVTHGVYRVEISKDAPIPKQVRQTLLLRDKSTHDLAYGKYGGFYLPHTLKRRFPGSGREIRLKLIYLTVNGKSVK